MKSTLAVAAVLGCLAFAQTPPVAHNTWSNGTPIPTAVGYSVAGVLGGVIYVVGGYNGTQILADTQIYNPVTNTWSTGTSLPVATSSASGAVVGTSLYFFGGSADNETPTNAVWAYNSKTKTWSAKAAMPTARWGTVAVVENKIIYVIGGETSPTGSNPLTTVESYNPASNTWTEEAPLMQPKDHPAGGLLGTARTGFTIVVANGLDVTPTGDNEGYSATTNTWRTLAADPTVRFAPCYGSIGQKFYDVSGGSASTISEVYQLSTNKWTTTLAPIPQFTEFPGSAVYRGKLYCFGGTAGFGGPYLSNVQIYQP